MGRGLARHEGTTLERAGGCKEHAGAEENSQRRGPPGWHMAAGGEGPKRGELRAREHQQ